MNALRLPVASTTVQQLRVFVDRAAAFCYRRCSAADGRFHLKVQSGKGCAFARSDRSVVQAQGVCVGASGDAEA
jgi:hypothetical protein